MNLDEFLTNALIESLQNGLIAPELITVYAGNYIAKSLITTDEITQVQNAVAAYQAAQASNSASASDSTPTSESTSTSDSTSATATASETVSN